MYFHSLLVQFRHEPRGAALLSFGWWCFMALALLFVFVLSRSVHDPDRRDVDDDVWWWWWWWLCAAAPLDVVTVVVVPTLASPTIVLLVPLLLLWLLLLLLLAPVVLLLVRSCKDVSWGLYSIYACAGSCNIFCIATRIFSISTWLDGDALRFHTPNISSLYRILITAPHISSLSFFKFPWIVNCCPINANMISSQYRDPKPLGNRIIHLPPFVLFGYNSVVEEMHDMWKVATNKRLEPQWRDNSSVDWQRFNAFLYAYKH